MAETEYTKGFRSGVAYERDRAINVIIKELKGDGWSDFSLSALVGVIEHG